MRHTWILLIAVLGVATTQYAAAGLVSAGPNGDLTIDTSTGLGWLDLSETNELSPAQVLAGAGGWISAGFRIATRAQVLQLFSDAGLTNTQNLGIIEYLPANYAPGLAFARLFNTAGTDCYGTGPASYFACGLAASPAGSYYYDIVNVGANFEGPDAGTGLAYIFENQATVDTIYGGYGVFMVRAVPGPDPLWLMLGGLGMLGAFRLRLKGL
jgi:hypothetical protein